MDQKNGLLIAIVDDEENIRSTVAYALQKEGYHTVSFKDGQEAWESIPGAFPDLFILDIIMPRMDGLELCKKLKTKNECLPIIFLTSRDEEFDRVLGLELGADDYLCKPFSMRELLARIKVLFRRISIDQNGQKKAEQELLNIGSLALDLARFEASWKKKGINLTVTEYMILHALAREPGYVKTRAQLLEQGYPYDAYISDRSVDTHIKRIRQKIMKLDPDFEGIETIYGMGYRYKKDT
ncbi:MAG: response regulator transcription factor [Spirochaetales bacterium]|nr:response regulator transcription factor [Spirochaetales bacterium]